MDSKTLSNQTATGGRDTLLTSQVAEITGIPECTLRYWRHANQGPPCYRLGKRVLYERAGLDAWIEAQKAATMRGGVA